MKCETIGCNLNVESNHKFCIGCRLEKEEEQRELDFFERTGKRRIEISELFGKLCKYDDPYCSTKAILTDEQIKKIKELLQ